MQPNAQRPPQRAGLFVVATAFIARSRNKSGGTAFCLEPPMCPAVVGAGNANTVRRFSMSKRFLTSVAAIALIAGVGAINAQGMKSEGGGAGGGAAMEKSAPAG